MKYSWVNMLYIGYTLGSPLALAYVGDPYCCAGIAAFAMQFPVKNLALRAQVGYPAFIGIIGGPIITQWAHQYAW